MSHKKKLDIDPLNPIVNIKGQLFTEGLTKLQFYATCGPHVFTIRDYFHK